MDETVDTAEQPTTAGPASEPRVYAKWARGELQAAILAHMRAEAEHAAQCDPSGVAHRTPHQIAKALNSHPGAVAYGMAQLTAKGELTQVSEHPKTYRAA